jgi:hypothetical protein
VFVTSDTIALLEVGGSREQMTTHAGESDGALASYSLD